MFIVFNNSQYQEFSSFIAVSIQCQSQGPVFVWKKGQGSNLPGQNEESFPFPVKSKKQNEFLLPVKSEKQKLNIISNYMFNKRVSFKSIHFSNPNQDLPKFFFGLLWIHSLKGSLTVLPIRRLATRRS